MNLKLQCAICKKKRFVSCVDDWSLSVNLPASGSSQSLGGLLNGMNPSEIRLGSTCTSCNRPNVVEGTSIVNETSKYLIVQAPRITVKTDEKGQIVLDKNQRTTEFKVHTKIDFPNKPLDLSAMLGVGSGSDGTKYEVFGMVEHVGSRYALLNRSLE